MDNRFYYPCSELQCRGNIFEQTLKEPDSYGNDTPQTLDTSWKLHDAIDFKTASFLLLWWGPLQGIFICFDLYNVKWQVQYTFEQCYPVLSDSCDLMAAMSLSHTVPVGIELYLLQIVFNHSLSILVVHYVSCKKIFCKVLVVNELQVSFFSLFVFDLLLYPLSPVKDVLSCFNFRGGI